MKMISALSAKKLEMKIRSEIYERFYRMEAREAEKQTGTHMAGSYTGTMDLENHTGIYAPEYHAETLDTESRAEARETEERAGAPKIKKIIVVNETESDENAEETKTPKVFQETGFTKEMLSDLSEILKNDKSGKTGTHLPEKPVEGKVEEEQSSFPETTKTEAARETQPILSMASEIEKTETNVAALAEKPQQPRKSSMLKDMIFLFAKIATIALVFTLLLTFLFGVVRYQEPSMAPMIKDGDLVIFYRYTQSGYLPRDVVALDYEGNRMVRRVVATAGDTVDISLSGLVINGALQQETEIYNKTEQYLDGISFPIVVPEGHVFVLSDYRTNATDSRVFGSVKIENTLGKVMAVIRRRNI